MFLSKQCPHNIQENQQHVSMVSIQPNLKKTEGRKNQVCQPLEAVVFKQRLNTMTELLVVYLTVSCALQYFQDCCHNASSVPVLIFFQQKLKAIVFSFSSRCVEETDGNCQTENLLVQIRNCFNTEMLSVQHLVSNL